MILPMIAGERAWKAADRACGADGLEGSAHYERIRQPGDDWAECDENAYMEALECMPPHYIEGGFCVCEAVCDGPHGTLYLTCVRRRGRFFAAYRIPSQNAALSFLLEVSA